MSDGEHRRPFEVVVNQSLYALFCYNIDAASCFIQNDDFVFPEDCSAYADQLALSQAEVTTVFLDL